MKKILSILLAIAMVFSLGVGAFADETGSESAGTESTGSEATGSESTTTDNKKINSTESPSNTASANVTASYIPGEPEAKWGTSAEADLTGSGTLAQALAAAAASSDVKYIQLQKSVTLTGTGYSITGGKFTLDLNGNTVSGSGSHVFNISTGDADVTFTDTATGGKVTNTSGAVVLVLDGKLTISKGTYESECDEAVQIAHGTVVINDGSFTSMQAGKVAVLNGGTLTINGGSFTGGLGAVSIEDGGTVTIKGGSFAAGSDGHIRYQSGKLDLSGYPTTTTTGTTPLTDLTVYNSSEDTVTVNDSTIKLPAGYAFYLSTDTTNQTTVTELAAGTKYAIKSTGGTTTTKYNVTVDPAMANGTVTASPTSAAEGETVTLTVTPATDYALDTLRVFDEGSNPITYVKSAADNTYTFTMPAVNVFVVATFKSTKAEITGITITANGWSNKGNTSDPVTITLTKDSGDVYLLATGENLEHATTDNMVKYGKNIDGVSVNAWTYASGNKQTSYPVNVFAAETTAFEIKYSNDGGTTWTGSGIYIQYQAETTSVGITWGSLSFTYSDEQESGADKGWSCEDGANKVTVANSGTSSINAGVAFTKSTEAANITNVTGTFDKSTATLAKDASETFTLTLSGKPDGALDSAQIGQVTVTITKAQ